METEEWRERLETAHAEWIAEARQLAREIAIRKGCVTSDDIWDACPPPATIDSRVMGAVFSRHEFEQTGYVKSRRPICHKRPIGTWVLK